MSVLTLHPHKTIAIAVIFFLLLLVGLNHQHSPSAKRPVAGTQILKYKGVEVGRYLVSNRPEMLVVYGAPGEYLHIVASRDHTTGALEGYEVEQLSEWNVEGPWEINLKYPLEAQTEPGIRWQAQHRNP